MGGTGFDGKRVDVTYHAQWQDGYGAQGWKLDVAMDDPLVIACTAYTGGKTSTSVLVHDILDHLVSGFPFSGYANEARATAMHGLRNGIEVRSSYEWMVDEILNDNACEEQLTEFLQGTIVEGVAAPNCPGEMMASLIANHGRAKVKGHMVEGLFRAGLSGIPAALLSWEKQHLDFTRMHAIGMCLQGLLVEAQDVIENAAMEYAKGRIVVGNTACEFLIGAGDHAGEQHIVREVV